MNRLAYAESGPNSQPPRNTKQWAQTIKTVNGMKQRRSTCVRRLWPICDATISNIFLLQLCKDIPDI